MTIHEIIPNLYLGSVHDIPHLPNGFEIFDVRGIISEHFLCEDNKERAEMLAEMIHQKLTSDKKVFVHCQAGMERSPLAIVVYLNKYHNMTYDQAYDLVQKKKPDIFRRLEWIGERFSW